MSDTTAPPITIVEFLTARLDEAEARENDKRRHVKPLAAWRVVGPSPDLIEVQRFSGGRWEWMSRSEYLAEFFEPNPDVAVLADIAAKRAIVKLHGDGHECPDGWLDSAETAQHTGWVVDCLTLRHLASVDSDHPDYRDGWKP